MKMDWRFRMKTPLLAMGLTAAALGLGVGCVGHHEREHRTVVVEEGPVYREVYVEGRPSPPPRVEIIVEPPHRGAVWEPGHWERHHNEWIWHRGHYR
jgi:hypothetical protein